MHRVGAGTAMLDEDQESRRASSRGIIPRAKIKTVKMTFVIVFGKLYIYIYIIYKTYAHCTALLYDSLYSKASV